ncbi:MAG: hypothetical protein AAGC66_03235 [Leifsonia sp.]
MTVLVINRLSLASRRYRDWIDSARRVVLVTTESSVTPIPASRADQLAGYDDVLIVPDSIPESQLESVGAELAKHHRVEKVIALSEADLLVAARIRAASGIDGPTERELLLFRDKGVMKSRLLAEGVPVLPSVIARDVSDIQGFAHDFGYPIVVKPTRGSGSVGVTVIDSSLALDVVRVKGSIDFITDPHNGLVEPYIEHELFHVDGLVRSGEVVYSWVSSQGHSSCLGMRLGRNLRSAILDPDDERAAGLRALAVRALHALGVAATSLFHAEIFSTPEGYFINEIAARGGGGRIGDMIRAASGVYLPEEYVRAETASHPREDSDRTLKSHSAGLLLVPRRSGVVQRVPTASCNETLIDLRVDVRPGDRLYTAQNSTDAAVSAIVRHVDREHVEWALDSVEELIDREFILVTSSGTEQEDTSR